MLQQHTQNTAMLRKLFWVATIALSCVAVFAFFTTSAQAASISLDPLPGIGKVSDGASLSDTGLGTANPVQTTSRIINALLQILGIFSLATFLYGGFLWIWARGNTETIQKAKDIMTGTAIGLILILGSYGIVQWVFVNLAYITRG